MPCFGVHARYQKPRPGASVIFGVSSATISDFDKLPSIPYIGKRA
jgi:hypothetical protein